MDQEGHMAAGERMQQLVKNPPPPAPGDYIAPYLGIISPICKNDMALRLAKWRAQKFNTGDPHDLPNGTPPARVHHLDLCYVDSPQPDRMADRAQPMPVPPRPFIHVATGPSPIPI